MSEITSAALPPKVKIRAYITSTPFWKGRGFERSRVCYLAGIPNSYPEWGGPARIDAGIVDLIKIMNEAGLITNYCCSGRPCDHSRGWIADGAWKNAYVSFADPLPESYMKMLPDGCVVENSNFGINRIIRFTECTPRELAKRWHKLKCRTLRWSGIQQGY